MHYQACYKFNLFHIKGTHNILADLFSRAYQNIRFAKNEYSLNKQMAQLVPEMTEPFVLDSSILYKYLSRESIPENADIFPKKRRTPSMPRPLSTFAKAYENCTNEEKYASSQRLLMGNNDPSIDKIALDKRIKEASSNSIRFEDENLTNFQSELDSDRPIVFFKNHPCLSKKGKISTQYDIHLKPYEKLTLPIRLKSKANTTFDCNSVN